MGVVIEFPARAATFRARAAGFPDRGCEVVILPVIRIDRYDDKPQVRPSRGGIQGGKRRRRALRP